MAKEFNLDKFNKFSVKKPVNNPTIEEKAVAAIHTPPTPSVSQSVVTDKEATTRITVETPNSLYLKLKTKAVSRKITLRAYILELIAQEVSDI